MPVAQDRLQTLQVCKLLQCVREKDKEQIEKMTLHGIPHLVNYNDQDEGLTALGVAATANDDDMIEFLLNLGAHPDVVDFKGRTASMRAAEYGHVQCLEKLVKASGDGDASGNRDGGMKITDLDGRGILFYCIAQTQRHAKCLELAVTHGAEVNNINKEGIPVFLQMCETASENEDMCLLLLQKGADPNSKAKKSGRTPLMAASESGSVKVVRAILEAGAKVDELDSRGNHAAHYAAKGGYLDVLMSVSGYGAQLNQTNIELNTPIHLAATEGHAMCCKFLSQRGCNPKPKNKEGNTARSIAKDKGHKDATKELRKAEKSFGKTGKNNEPWAIELYDWVLEREQKVRELFKKYDASEKGSISKDDFTDSLLGMNAPANEEDLRKIAFNHDKNRDSTVDIEEFLAAKKYINKNYLKSAFEGKKKKKKGGKKGKKKGKFKLSMPICVQDEGQRTLGGAPPAMYIPRHIHFTDTGRFDRDCPPKHPLQDDSAWYLQHPEKTYMNINDAVRSEDLDSIKNALQKGTAVDTRDKYYKTPLMVACAIGNMEMVTFLMENGANINARDNFKWTPLHHACHSGQLDIVQLLLEHGAEMDAATMNGGTPLMRAIESSKETVVQYLINRGAKVQTENKKGHSPLDYAIAWADPRVLDIVQTKWDSLPPPNDKKKGKGGKKGGGTKRPASVPPDTKDSQGLKPQTPAQLNVEDMIPRARKGSILRAASALAGGLDEKEDVTYTPLKAWTKQPTTEELIDEKGVKRERFGWEVDFEDFEMPFNKNVSKKVEEMGGVEDD